MILCVAMARFVVLLSAIAARVMAETATIYKVDYPETGFCGQESNVTKSRLNPHWFFPMTFGGFKEGNCSDVGFTRYKSTEVKEMHPVPGVYHNLTFDIYYPTQTKTIEVELKDPSREKRTVMIKFCMPSGPGKWPLYLFNHGAGCDAEDYQYFCQVAATAMIYQKSPAGSIFPADFDIPGDALDAAFLALKLPELSKGDPTSPFFGKLDDTVVLGGHSMGGGVTVLSAGMDKAPVNGIAMFAPGLYTSLGLKPDATSYLANVTMPALIVSGSMDCGPNALDKQAQPAFDGLGSKTKVLVVLKGANHCQWTQSFEKGFGVCKASGNECHSITRAFQHQSGASLVNAFIGGLESDEGWNGFEQLLALGEAMGTWTYISSRAPVPGKILHNDCSRSGASTSSLLV